MVHVQLMNILCKFNASTYVYNAFIKWAQQYNAVMFQNTILLLVSTETKRFHTNYLKIFSTTYMLENNTKHSIVCFNFEAMLDLLLSDPPIDETGKVGSCLLNRFRFTDYSHLHIWTMSRGSSIPIKFSSHASIQSLPNQRIMISFRDYRPKRIGDSSPVHH